MIDKLEQMGEGRQIVRGADGRIEKMVITSEAARAMAQGKAKNKVRDTTASQLLAEAGFTNENAPEHLRLLSEIASSKRSGAVPALRDFRRLTRVEASEPAVANNLREVELVGGDDYLVKIGLNLYRKVSGREAHELVELIREAEAEGG